MFVKIMRDGGSRQTDCSRVVDGSRGEEHKKMGKRKLDKF